MTTGRMIDELLLKGADDWVMAADVAWLAKSIGGAVTDGEVAELSFHAISEVVSQGLMQLGDVADGGFIDWDLTPEDAVEKAQRRWTALCRLPDLGEVCWLANTPAGDLRATATSEERE